MVEISRRTFLYYLGLGSAIVGCESRAPASRWPLKSPSSLPNNRWSFHPVSYPVPLPGGQMAGKPLETFIVKDSLTVPEGFSWKVLAQWGDVFGPTSDSQRQIEFGYNCDFTALIPKRGAPKDYWLCVNHEYVSARPWTEGYAAAKGHTLPPLSLRPGTDVFNDHSDAQNDRKAQELDIRDDRNVDDALISAARSVSQLALEELGVSILHARINPSDELEIVKESPEHKRITTTHRVNCAVSSIAKLSGPAALLGISSEGTACNCSGGVTPWGTLLTCEENFQDIVAEGVRPDGVSFPTPHFSAEGAGDEQGIPVAWVGTGAGAAKQLDARGFGWVTEIDPETGSLTKHTALGRFRHENIALCVKEGEPIKAYMGDDRRGGHVWRFVSDGKVNLKEDPSSSSLLTKGVLSVAQFDSKGEGRWIPLAVHTPLAVPTPEYTATRAMQLPYRPGGGAVTVAVYPNNPAEFSVSQYVRHIEAFVGKPFNECVLGDLVTAHGHSGQDAALYKQGIILTDAFLMANAVGGTPTARPEDLEVDPFSDNIFVAFTEASGAFEGSPDVRIFPDSDGSTSRQYGAIFTLIDGKDDKFSWQKLITSGEVYEGGSGLACADNLVIDANGDLWVVCDISTKVLNAAVTQEGSSRPGTAEFMGIFGNSSLFRFKRTPEGLGNPECFAVGPCECELTGPTFLPNGRGLILSVQHPGEQNGTRNPRSGHGGAEQRRILISDLQGRAIEQIRHIPIGSNFPSGILGKAPRPAVVMILPPPSKRMG